jgi:hypothetical protein
MTENNRHNRNNRNWEIDWLKSVDAPIAKRAYSDNPILSIAEPSIPEISSDTIVSDNRLPILDSIKMWWSFNIYRQWMRIHPYGRQLIIAILLITMFASIYLLAKEYRKPKEDDPPDAQSPMI